MNFTNVRTLFATCALATLVAMLAAPASATAASPIHFSLAMFGSCLGGDAAGPTVSFSWRGFDGTLKASGSVSSSAYDTWDYCSPDPSVALTPGDKLNVSDGTNSRKFVVPNLTMSLDRVNDVVTGTGPAGRTIRLCSTFSFFGDWAKCHGIRVDRDGTWVFDPNRDIIGDIWAEISLTTPNDDHLYLAVAAPHLRVTIGKALFSGGGAPLRDFGIAINGVAAGNATIDSNGSFTSDFRKPNGSRLVIAAGDRVTAPSLSPDLDWVVPEISGSVDRFSNEVSGVCGDTGTSDYFVEVSINRHGQNRGTGWQPTEPDGSFTMDFNETPPWGGTTNIRFGDNVTIGCMQTEGDYAQLMLRAE